MSYKRLKLMVSANIKDISSESGMAEVLTTENIGKCYRFTGDTGTYINDDLYVVSENLDFSHKIKYDLVSSDTYRFRHYKTEVKYITVPTVSGSLIYNKYTQEPTIIDYDATKMSMAGTSSAINAGTYTLTITPKSGYEWDDGTGSTTKSFSWVIHKDTPVITLSANQISGTVGSQVIVRVVSYTGESSLYASMIKSGYASVTIKGYTIYCTLLKAGTAMIGVASPETTNYYSTTAYCSVTITA